MKKSVYFAIFCISCSVLIFETILLKFFSFKMMSSCAFLIVSIAFLGIGASGSYLYLKKSKALQGTDFSFLSNFSVAYVISIPLSIMLFASIPFSPHHDLVLPNVIFDSFYMILFSIPFFLSGVCIAYILSLKEFHVGKILFFDLMGAGLGCVFSVLFLRMLGAYGVLCLSMGFAYLAFIIFHSLFAEKSLKSSTAKIKVFLPIMLFFASLAYPHIMIRFYQFDIVSTNREEHHFKIFKEDFHGIEATYWNPITRIDLSKEGESDKYVYLFGLSEKFRNRKYTGRYILLDSGAATRQFRFDGDQKDKEFLGHFLFSIPYRLVNHIKEVLIIGPGGVEILIGKYFKANHIDAVDINSDVINILTGKNSNDRMASVYSGFTSSNTDTMVSFHTQEGRSFLSKNIVDKYDVVQLTGVDLFSALASGGMILSENYLYTQEALGYYYDALKAGGHMQICYWGGTYALRLFITSLEMLKSKGVEFPECSLVVVGDDMNMTNIIIKKGLFSKAEVAGIEKICADDGFGVLFTPHMTPDMVEYASWGDISTKDYMLASRSESREALVDSLVYNVSPTHDDKPFFYSVLRYSGKGDSALKNLLTTLFQNKIVLALTIMGVILSFMLILLPLIVERIQSNHTERMPFKLLPFFGFVGLAFSLIEVVVLQKFAIFVGGPFYSMCVVLPTILIFYSLGALFAAQIKFSGVRLLVLSIGGIVLYSFIGYLFFDEIFKSFFYLNHLQRTILAIAAISPLGFFLGFPVPVVLEAVKGGAEGMAVPWMWSVNSCANVGGALLFVPISQTTGFNLLLLVSGCLYLIALFLLLPQTKIFHEKLGKV